MSESPAWSASRLLNVLQRRSKVFVWTTLALLAAAAAFVSGLPNVYRASASLLVQGKVSDMVSASASSDGIDGRLQTIKQEALSRARLTDLLNRFDLYGVASGRTPLARGLERVERDIRVEPTSTDQSARGGAQTIAFRVSYVGSDPRSAADVVNALATFFVAQNDEMRAAQASRTTEFLAAQLKETQTKLAGQEGQVRAFSSRNLGALPQQMEANLAAINRLDAQLRLQDGERSKLIERRQTLKNDLAALQAAPPAPADTSPQAQTERLERELADLRMKFGDNYPDVKAAQARLETARRTVPAAALPVAARAQPSQKAVLEQGITEVDGQLTQLESAGKSIQQQIAQYQGRVEQAPAQAPAFDGLVREYQSTRDQVDALQKRYSEARLAERAEVDANTQEFRVLDPALPPTETAGPSRVLLLMIGSVFAFFAGLVAVVALDQVDTSFHSVDDLRQFTNVPVLASVPVMASRGRFMGHMREVAWAGTAILMIAALAQGAFVVARASEQVARLLSRVM